MALFDQRPGMSHEARSAPIEQYVLFSIMPDPDLPLPRLKRPRY